MSTEVFYSCAQLRHQMRRNYAPETLQGFGYLATNYIWALRETERGSIWSFLAHMGTLLSPSGFMSAPFIYHLSEEKDQFRGRLAHVDQRPGFILNSQVDLWSDFRWKKIHLSHDYSAQSALLISYESDISTVPFFTCFSPLSLQVVQCCRCPEKQLMWITRTD